MRGGAKVVGGCCSVSAGVGEGRTIGVLLWGREGEGLGGDPIYILLAGRSNHVKSCTGQVVVETQPDSEVADVRDMDRSNCACSAQTGRLTPNNSRPARRWRGITVTDSISQRKATSEALRPALNG